MKIVITITTLLCLGMWLNSPDLGDYLLLIWVGLATILGVIRVPGTLGTAANLQGDSELEDYIRHHGYGYSDLETDEEDPE